MKKQARGRICLRLFLAARRPKKSEVGSPLLKLKMSGNGAFSRVFFILPVLLLGLVAYSNSFHVPFQFDDMMYIVDNPLVRDFGLYGEFTASDSHLKADELRATFKSRALAFLSFRANYLAGGLDVTGYHIVNLSIHLVNAVLVFLLTLITLEAACTKRSLSVDKDVRFKFGIVAMAASALFVAHPVQTQAVTYISQRFASLATLFYLGALVAYAGSRTAGRLPFRWMLYVLSALMAILAMKTKEVSFTLPVMVAALEFMFFKGAVKRRLLMMLPFLVTMFIIPLDRMDFSRGLAGAIEAAVSAAPNLGISPVGYLLTEPRVIVTYLRMILFPINQVLDYDYPAFHSLLEPDVLFSISILGLIVILGIYFFMASRRAESPLRAGGLALCAIGVIWFLLTFSVESSAVVLRDVIFEHRLYLPSVGIFAALSAGSFMMIGRARVRRPVAVFAILFIALSLTLACASIKRNAVWRTSVALWEDNVQKSPHKARPRVELAKAYRDAGRLDESIEQYTLALEIDPLNADAANNLGNLYRLTGRLEDAITNYRRAVAINAGFMPSYYNLGVCYLELEDLNRAREYFEAAHRLEPYSAEVNKSLGNLYLILGMDNEAAKYLESALRYKPELKGLHSSLATAYSRLGREDLAEEHLRLSVGQ